MPKAYILIGIPGSGKTTWIGHQKIDWDKTAYISTDKYVDQQAIKQGKTYSEVFNDSMKEALEQMVKDVHIAVKDNKDIFWDQTSTSILSRKRKFNMLTGYEMIAVVFPTPEQGELDRRLKNRPGKVIPDDVIKNMIDNFEHPTYEEGFDKIMYL